ncbi:hypothetical protein, partial [Faecalibaculum rodentium]|uniref:hypothetical protein n=1 Tax=Faecalibaculum rodentium TaxID=1702221 RepID=UPI00263514A5
MVQGISPVLIWAINVAYRTDEDRMSHLPEGRWRDHDAVQSGKRAFRAAGRERRTEGRRLDGDRIVKFC